MKNLKFILPILFIIVLVGAGCQIRPNNNGSDYTIYSNLKYDFSFEYPQNWQLKDNAEFDTVFLSSKKEQAPMGEVSKGARIEIFIIENNKYLQLEKWIEWNKSQRRSEQEVLESKEITISNKKAIQETFSAPTGPVEQGWPVTAYFSDSDNSHIIQINYTGREPDYSKEIEIFQHILETFEFKKSTIVLDGALLDVPFIVQAPYSNWDDPIFQDACEEASLIMAFGWLNGIDNFTDKEVYEKIIDMNEFEKRNYGAYIDLDAAHTAQLMKDYFNYNNISVVYDFTIKDIKEELEKGNLVITPMNGRALGNPYYTSPGPQRHMVVIIGYNDSEFITNDPGVGLGAGYKYDQKLLFDSIRNYETGNRLPIKGGKAMIIVENNK